MLVNSLHLIVSPPVLPILCIDMSSSHSKLPSDRELDLTLNELTSQLVHLQQTAQKQEEESASYDKEINQLKRNLLVVMEKYKECLTPESYLALMLKFPPLE